MSQHLTFTSFSLVPGILVNDTDFVPTICTCEYITLDTG